MINNQILPLLNNPDYVIPKTRTDEDDNLAYYDVKSMLTKRTHCTSVRFDQIYYSALRHFTQSERLEFKMYQTGEKAPEYFQQDASNYLRQNYPKEMSDSNDFLIMMERLNTSMFGYDFIDPLIHNDKISDIKICNAKDIRVRVDGKAMKSNITFTNDRDLYRFIDGIGIRNGIDILSSAIITFTDKTPKDFILRFEISSPIIVTDSIPTIHIRKVDRNKPDFKELYKRGMITPRVAEYLIEKAKSARTITFAGPPGSGKTQILNAEIEYIPKWRETLVIQENEELSTNQSGFIFEHVTHGFKGEASIDLEELGRHALVQGCNEFIIGEVKGAEMRSAATLFQTGGYGMWTVHSDSAEDVLPRCAALIKEGTTYSLDEACNRLKDCKVIVYLEGYKVQEILECTGYNTETHKFEYTEIYKRELDEEALALDKAIIEQRKREQGYL